MPQPKRAKPNRRSQSGPLADLQAKVVEEGVKAGADLAKDGLRWTGNAARGLTDVATRGARRRAEIRDARRRAERVAWSRQAKVAHTFDTNGDPRFVVWKDGQALHVFPEIEGSVESVLDLASLRPEDLHDPARPRGRGKP